MREFRDDHYAKKVARLQKEREAKKKTVVNVDEGVGNNNNDVSSETSIDEEPSSKNLPEKQNPPIEQNPNGSKSCSESSTTTTTTTTQTAHVQSHMPIDVVQPTAVVLQPDNVKALQLMRSVNDLLKSNNPFNKTTLMSFTNSASQQGRDIPVDFPVEQQQPNNNLQQLQVQAYNVPNFQKQQQLPQPPPFVSQPSVMSQFHYQPLPPEPGYINNNNNNNHDFQSTSLQPFPEPLGKPVEMIDITEDQIQPLSITQRNFTTKDYESYVLYIANFLHTMPKFFTAQGQLPRCLHPIKNNWQDLMNIEITILCKCLCFGAKIVENGEHIKVQKLNEDAYVKCLAIGTLQWKKNELMRLKHIIKLVSNNVAFQKLPGLLTKLCLNVQLIEQDIEKSSGQFM